MEAEVNCVTPSSQAFTATAIATPATAARPTNAQPGNQRRPAPLGEASVLGVLAPFLDLGRLAAQVAQVIELRPADVATGGDLDLLDDR